MTNESKKMVKNIIILVLLCLPCGLLLTGELFLMFLGAVYTMELWNNILKPLMKRYREWLVEQEKIDM